jgi:hypothetical protein
MKRDTCTIEEYELGQSWRPIVEAAGLYNPAQDPFTIFRLAGLIMRDEIVTVRRMAAFAKFRWSPEEQAPPDPTLDILLTMTAAEKASLIDRVYRAVGIRRK